MEMLLLCLAELKILIASTKPSVVTVSDGDVRWVSMTDVLYEIESIKKSSHVISKLWHFRSGTSAFHSESQCGNVCCIDLDNYAIENGLFEIAEDYRQIGLWQKAADRGIAPEESARLICLRYIDDCFEIALCEGALTEYYGT